MLIKISVHNRGPEAAEIHLLPTLWFRNTWSWEEDAAKPTLRQGEDGTILASHGTAWRPHASVRRESRTAVHGK